MWVLVTYDVATDSAAGRRRLRRVALACQDFGQRVQKSVFECTVDQVEYEKLRHALLRRINLREDSLRFYKLQEPRSKHVEEFGLNGYVDFKEPLIA